MIKCVQANFRMTHSSANDLSVDVIVFNDRVELIYARIELNLAYM